MFTKLFFSFKKCCDSMEKYGSLMVGAGSHPSAANRSKRRQVVNVFCDFGLAPSFSLSLSLFPSFYLALSLSLFLSLSLSLSSRVIIACSILASSRLICCSGSILSKLGELAHIIILLRVANIPFV